MSQRKPRRKGPARKAKPVGTLWWAAGIVAVGWIAFDANRTTVERHVPALASVRMPWEDAKPAAVSKPAPRQAAVRAPSAPSRTPEASRSRPSSNIRTATPEARPARPAAIAPSDSPARPPPPAAVPSSPMARTRAAAMSSPSPAAGLRTRQPTPLKREPSAGAPVWMVLDPGKPLRVTRREGAWSRVEAGIFTGWVETALIETPRRAGTMPTLAAAHERRAGPVPAAGVPER